MDEEAVYRKTGLTAKSFGLKDRGFIREGYYADFVLFDPKTILDTATFSDPEQAAAGIHHVFVNGQPIWQEGRHTQIRAGHVLRRKDYNKPQMR